MIVAIDVDSTLYDSTGLFARVAKEHYDLDIPTNSSNWHDYYNYAPVEKLVKIFRKSHSKEYVEKNVPYPEAVDVIQMIEDKGHAVYFVSDRHPQAATALNRWLSRYFLADFDKVIVGQDKREWMKETKPDIVIDDRVRTMIFARFELGATVFSIQQPWNINLMKEIDKIFICENWQQIGTKVEEYI